MNPVAATYLKKALKRIAEREGISKMIKSATLDTLAGSSNGDLRAAVSDLNTLRATANCSWVEGQFAAVAFH